MRSSRSWLICAGWMLLRPLRAMRGLRASRRWPDTSKAYRRPVLRMAAPSARVLPPAPAQKSTTISPRLASVNRASSWLPSSCTSTSPRVKTSSLFSAGLPCTRSPQGEKGVGATVQPASTRALSTSSRLAFRVLTRRSSGALADSASTRGQKPSPRVSCSGVASQSGRLWRSFSGSVARSMARTLASQACSSGWVAAFRKASLPCQASSARRRSSGPLPLCARWAQSRRWRSTA